MQVFSRVTALGKWLRLSKSSGIDRTLAVAAKLKIEFQVFSEAEK